MATTKKKPAQQDLTGPPNALNGPTSEVLTLAEAATYLRVSEAEVVEMMGSQNLPGRFTGKEWRFLKSAIQEWLSAGSGAQKTQREAQLALAGKYKDDPDLLRICEDAYRRRGRPVSEDD